MTAVAFTEGEGTGTLTVHTHRCVVCGQPCKLTGVPEAGFLAWVAGEMIQQALPALSASERELLISGTHGECYEKLFADEDEPAKEAGDFPVIPQGQIAAEVAADVRRLTHQRIAEVETGARWRGPAQHNWDDSR